MFFMESTDHASVLNVQQVQQHLIDLNLFLFITGTASLLPSRPQAAAVASVALVSTGIVHAAVCALPGVPQLLNKLGSLRS